MALFFLIIVNSFRLLGQKDLSATNTDMVKGVSKGSNITITTNIKPIT